MPPRSRNHSRAASPALSIRSRRSMMSSRSRQKYQPQDLTDDEDSDIEHFTDDSRSRSSRRPASLHGDALRSHRHHRQRNNSESIELDHHEAEVINRIQKMKEKSKFIRERRSGSLTNWPTTRDRDSGSLSPSDEEIKRVSRKYHSKQSLMSPQPHHKKKQHRSDTDSDVEKESSRRHKGSATIKSQSTASSKAPQDSTQSPLVEQEIIRESTTMSKSEQLNNSSSDSRPLKVVKSSASPTPPPPPTVSSEPAALKVEQKPVKVQNQAAAAVSSSDKRQIEIPLVDWECEHCTFVNEATAKICTICCKTRCEVLDTLPPPPTEDDFDVKAISESIMRNENDDSDSKQKGKARKISFLPGTKAH